MILDWSSIYLFSVLADDLDLSFVASSVLPLYEADRSFPDNPPYIFRSEQFFAEGRTGTLVLLGKKCPDFFFQ